MDDEQFDSLAITLTAEPTRRGLISALLAAVTLGTAVTTEAGSRGGNRALARKRDKARKRPARRGKRKGKRKGEKGNGNGGAAGCTSDARDLVCAGSCGPVTDACGKQVECEPCGDCSPGAPAGTACVLTGERRGVCMGGACQTCGGEGQQCCSGDQPCDDFGCCDPETGRCVAGGGAWDNEFVVQSQCSAENTVCDCRPAVRIGNEGSRLICTGPGACRLNHRPRVAPVTVRSPWRSPCVPIVMTGLDADGDPMSYWVTTQPKFGTLTLSDSHYSATAGSAADGLTSGAGEQAPGAGKNGALAWEGLPAPPLPQAEINCVPRVYFHDLGSIPGGGICPDCGGGPNGGHLYCPEGFYWQWAICYISVSPTFTGFDSFQYVAVDSHGAVSEPVTVQIEIYEQ